MNNPYLRDKDLNSLIVLLHTTKVDITFNDLVKEEIQYRISINKNVSREFIYEVCNVKGLVMTIEFIPTSESFKRINGKSITIRNIIACDELIDIKKNYATKPVNESFGIIKTDLLNQEDYTEEEISNFSKNGFDTQDILTKYHKL